MRRVFQVCDWIIEKTLYAGGAAVLFIMVYTSLNVILRVLRHPLPGDTEVTVSALVVTIYSTIAACLIHDAHIRIELFKKWPWLDHLNNLAACAIAAVISFQTFKQVRTAARMHVTSTLLGIPRAPFLFVAALGFLLFAVAALSVEYRLCAGTGYGRKGAAPTSGNGEDG